MPTIGQTQFGGKVGEIQTFDLPNRLSSAFDIEAFDEAIQAHGARFVHYRAMDNPVGMIERFDSRRPDPDHSGSSNGQIYTKAGCFSALFTGNSKEAKAQEGGLLDSATAQLTPTRNYNCDCTPVYLSPLDRLYLEEESILVTHKQMLEASATGVDRLRFPAVQVLDCIDAHRNRYVQSIDFQLVDGQIVWGPRRPGDNPESGKGVVYSVRFMYRPYWYVSRMLHEIRVAQVENQFTGERSTARMQQSCIVQREYLFENEQRDPEAPNPDSPRQAPAPADGGFEPR